MDFLNTNGDQLISNFPGRVAHVFNESNQALVTYDKSKVTKDHHEGLSDILEADELDYLHNNELIIAYRTPDGNRTSYTVNGVDDLSEVNEKGTRISDTIILLFYVTQTTTNQL